jgi:hypothetical protein
MALTERLQQWLHKQQTFDDETSQTTMEPAITLRHAKSRATADVLQILVTSCGDVEHCEICMTRLKECKVLQVWF